MTIKCTKCTSQRPQKKSLQKKEHTHTKIPPQRTNKQQRKNKTETTKKKKQQQQQYENK